MSEASENKRADLYREHPIQLLLSKFIGGEINRLEPVYDQKHGYGYPLVESIVGSSSEANKLLKRLHEVGVLNRELYDKIIFCPHCNSANVSIHYCCPYCKSFDVKKSVLIEHVQCGYIDVEEKFKVGNKLVCPKCGKDLSKVDVDYRKAGIWCSCNECGKSFDIPVTSHFCRDCRETFTFEDCVYENVYAYTLSEKAVKEAGLGLVLVAPIKEFLEKNGFKVESPGFLKGKSGASHMFDITAFRSGISRDVTVIDLATSVNNVVSEQPVIAMFAKTYDVAPDKACLIAIPEMSENGKRMAALYNIELIEAKDQNAAVEALKRIMLKKQSSKRKSS